MSFSLCIQSAIDDDEVRANREIGEKAQRLWKDKSDQYERQGYNRQDAEYAAAEDVKAAFKREAGVKRSQFLATIASQRKNTIEVQQADDFGRDAIQKMNRVDYRGRALKRLFDAKISEYLAVHHRNLLGQTKNPLRHDLFLEEMFGESTGDEMARAMADAVRFALEDMRLMANQKGAFIGKLENWFPQQHNRTNIISAGLERWGQKRGLGKTRAKISAMRSAKNRDEMFAESFNQWFDDIDPDLDWTKIENRATGRPFHPEGGLPPADETKRRFLKEVFDNIVYGKDADNPGYGRPQGQALYKSLSQSRQLFFKNSKAWTRYNSKYGMSDPHGSLMAHVHGMARDIAVMHELGPNPYLGLDFRNQTARKEAKARGQNPENFEGKLDRAMKMLKVERGSGVPSGYWSTMFANFMGSSRGLQMAAFLDSASLASISDLNSMKMAGQMIGAGRTAPFRNYMGVITDMVKEGAITTDEMKQFMWVADTTADPGAAVARFNGESPGGAWAQTMSSSVMRLQGLSQHTDAGRFSQQKLIGGQFANHVGTRFDALPEVTLKILKENGITGRDWEMFARPENLMTAGNGAKFLNPLYWRASTDMPGEMADDLFLKFQGAYEDIIETAVPTQSLFIRSIFDPTAYDIRPGEPVFEMLKSSTAFKSFIMAQSHNIVRSMERMPANQRWLWLAENIAGATLFGALSVQLIELSKGNDPMNMNPVDHPSFMAKAALKGGGFAALGDIIATGETSWGGGLGGWAAGPSWQLFQDAYELGPQNLHEAGIAIITGKPMKTNAGREFTTMVDRYLPGGDLPWLRAPVDRLIMDSMYKTLDPEGTDYIAKKSQRTNNLNSTDGWWLPGSPLPERAPDLSNAFGG